LPRSDAATTDNVSAGKLFEARVTVRAVLQQSCSCSKQSVARGSSGNDQFCCARLRVARVVDPRKGRPGLESAERSAEVNSSDSARLKRLNACAGRVWWRGLRSGVAWRRGRNRSGCVSDKLRRIEGDYDSACAGNNQRPASLAGIGTQRREEELRNVNPKELSLLRRINATVNGRQSA
jgi:hypothetical protein